jgi:hypothetical protein
VGGGDLSLPCAQRQKTSFEFEFEFEFGERFVIAVRILVKKVPVQGIALKMPYHAARVRAYVLLFL